MRTTRNQIQLQFNVLIFICCLFCSCEDDVEIDIPKGGANKLVVEAFIEVKSGIISNFNQVYLSRSTEYDTEPSAKDSIPDASVTLITEGYDTLKFIPNNRDRYLLWEDIYADSTYKLRIELSDGGIYESNWQKAPREVEIDTLAFLKTESILGVPTELAFSAIYPSVSFKDEKGIENFYFLDVHPTKITSPNLRLTKYLTLSDADFTDGSILPLGVAWFDVLVEPKDKFIVGLSNINEETYTYFTELKALLLPSTPFSTPKTSPIQNIHNIANPREQVLGHFAIFNKSKIEATYNP